MKYKATIITKHEQYSKIFNTIIDAVHWLDSENTDGEATTMIETFDETGEKKDGFFYTENKK